MAGVALVACQNKEEDVVESTCVPEDDVVFYAEMEHEQDTKVFADANLKVLWDADDLITIFNKYTYNRQYRFQGETGDNAGVFKPEPNEEMVTGNEISTIYAVYPYQPSTTISNASVISYVLPENQEYARNSFGKGANLMVSSTEDNFLLFRNVGGYLGIKLYGEGVSISQVSIQGNNGEILSGKASITAPINGIPEISMAADADPLVSVVSATPVALGSSAEDYTEFWFVLPPVTFEEGLTVTVTDAMGRTFQQSTTNTITIERSRITRLAPVEVEIEGQPANQIWYTTSDGEIVEPNNPDGFGANIVSNTYENGLGIITFDQPLTSIGQYAFRSGNLASIIFPEGVEELNNYVCLWCYDLTSVSIPNSVAKITSNAFSGCYNLSSYSGKFATPDGRLLIMDGTVITFAPGGLSAYEIPEGVTVIGGSSFANTQNLRSIVIPEGVTTIEAWAFEGSGLTSINIPNSVESFGTAPFRGCDRLASITGKFASEDERLLVVDGEVIASAMVGLSEYAIPDGITILGYGSFAYSPIVSLVIPEGVWAIDYDVFWACSEMQSIVLPSTIEMILENSFSYCESLQSIIICADVPPEIPSGLFSTTNDCPIYVPDEAILDYVEAENWSEYADRIQGIMYMDIGTEQPNNEIWYTSTDGEIVEPYATVSGSTMISNTYKNGKGVMRFDSEIDVISSYAFKGCENLSSITLPEIVDLGICEGAFMDCYSLTSVELPEGIVWIGDNAFNACPFTSIQLPESLEGIGERAFANTALTSVTIPENTGIGEAAFSNCRSLRSFESEYATEDGLLLIIDAMVNSCAIAGMADVAEYQIPEGVTSIGPLAFAACTKTNFIMPESLNCIYHAAFYCCYGLSDVILPKSVWYIESQAFDACRGMQSITVLSQKPPQGGRSMLDGTNNCPIYVPDKSVDAYKQAEYWSDYADRIQARPVKNYLTFASEGTSTISLTNSGNAAPVLYYSYDKQSWTLWDYSELEFTENTPLHICGDNPNGFCKGYPNYSTFSSGGDLFGISGSIMSLINKDEDVQKVPWCGFYALFSGCENLTTPPSLPATQVNISCYYEMFKDCTSLTTAPELPATSLFECDACYQEMFSGCTSLVSVPASLPATVLSRSCYREMFRGCTSLVSAPALPAEELTDGCYAHMFLDCSSLAKAPALPAKKLANYCYGNMFRNCTSLSVAPELPATELVEECYWCMFWGCTSLTAAPVLPAKTLVADCYNRMFISCSNLQYVKCLATDISAENCVQFWMSGVSNTGTFVKAAGVSDWVSGVHGIPSGWTVLEE